MDDNTRGRREVPPQDSCAQNLQNGGATASPFALNCAEYLERGFSVIPIAPRQKFPGTYDGNRWKPASNWSQYSTRQMTVDEVDAACTWPEAGIALCPGKKSGVVALDWDYDGGVRDALEAITPPSPVRKVGSKGYTALYRYNGETTKRWTLNGERVLELLSDGTQTVLPPSIHPSTGAPYYWQTEDSLDSIDLDELPTLPDDYFEQVDAIIQAHGGRNTGAGGGSLGAEVEPVTLPASEMDELAQALAYIPSDDYDVWVRVGMALKTVGGPGFFLWDNWSRRSSKYDHAASLSIRHKWDGFAVREGGVTHATIFALAREHGYTPAPVNLFDHIAPGTEGNFARMALARRERSNPRAKRGGRRFSDFAVTETAEEMEARMAAQSFVLPGMAVKGQWTVLYARPNTGKTLLTLTLLCQQIEQGEIVAEHVCYVNADDHPRGIAEKKRLAQEFGFQLLVPGKDGFKTDLLLPVMDDHVAGDYADECIVVLDTVKKFTDLMSKQKTTEFGKSARAFVAAGGTIIGLAHVNKRKGEDGKDIHAGTSDLVDDADCVYMLGVVEDADDSKVVDFENIKARGDVQRLATYRYVTSGGYRAMFDSVRPVDEESRKKAEGRRTMGEKLARDNDCIEAIKRTIADGATAKTEIVKACASQSRFSRAQVTRVLESYTGDDLHKGHRWRLSCGDKNRHTYALLSASGGGGRETEKLGKLKLPEGEVPGAILSKPASPVSFPVLQDSQT